MLQDTYQMINHRLFDGELPECNIYWLEGSDWFDYPIDGIHTCYIFDDGHIEHFIGIPHNLDIVKYFNAMVHEMIHAWQIENSKPHNHGKLFKSWCKKAYEEFYE